MFWWEDFNEKFNYILKIKLKIFKYCKGKIENFKRLRTKLKNT